MSFHSEKGQTMDLIIAILVGLTLVGFIQGLVYHIYLKTNRKKRALMPNLIILGIGLATSALVTIVNSTMGFGWGEILVVFLLSLTAVAFMISTLTSALMMYVMDLKKRED